MSERIVGIEREKEELSMYTQWCEVSFGGCIAWEIACMHSCAGDAFVKKIMFSSTDLSKKFGDRALLWVFEDNMRKESKII